MNCLEGSVFENICMALTAFGTVGATIVALYFNYNKNKLNRSEYDIRIGIIGHYKYDSQPDTYGTFYGIKIVNLSFNKNITLNKLPYYKYSRKKPIPFDIDNLLAEYLPKNILLPGEEYTFPIKDTYMREFLNKSKSNKFTFYFVDRSKNKYCIEITKESLDKINTKYNEYMQDYEQFPNDTLIKVEKDLIK